MTGVGGAEIEVTGDVRQFARQTERDLDRALSRIKVQKVKVEPDVDRNRFGNLLRKAFAPDPEMFSALRAPFAAALSSPIGAAVVAVAATAAAAFVGAFAAALATAGLGAAFLGLGVAALAGTKEIQSAASKLGDTLKEVGRAAAQPLLDPLVKAMGSLESAAKRIEPLLTKIFASLAPAIQPLTDGIAGFVEEFLKVLTADPKTLEGMRDALTAIGENLPRLGTALGELFGLLAGNENNVRNIGLLFGLIESSIGSLSLGLLGLSKILDYLVFGWTNVINAGKSFVSWITGTAVPAVTGAVLAIGGFFQDLPGRIRSALSSLPGLVAGVFSSMASKILYLTGYVLGSVVAFFAQLPGRIRSAMSALPGLVASVFSSAASSARSGASSLVSGAISIVRNLPGRIRSALSSVRSAVTGAFAGAGSWLVSAGRAIISGVSRGIAGAISGAVSAARNAAKRIVSGFKDALSIGSPSRLMALEVGRPITQGIAAGITKNAALVDKAVREIVPSINLDAPAFTVPTGRPRGGDGASSGGANLGGVTFNIYVSGATGQDAGEEAATVILERLGQAALARG